MSEQKNYLGNSALSKLISLIHVLFTGLTTTITNLTNTVTANKTAADTGIQEAKDAAAAASTAVAAEQTRAEAAEKANSDAIDELKTGLVGPDGDIADLNDLTGRVETLESKSHDEPTEMSADDVQTAWDAIFTPTTGG